jgi:hypothetical protein
MEMSEQTEAGTTESVPAPVKTPGKGSPNWKTMAVVIAVVALIILAVASYLMWKPEDDEDVLEATVTPAAVTIEAGDSVALVANVSWDGESVNEAVGVSFAWSLSDSQLGSISSPSARITSFVAGKVGGSGTITCSVTYVNEDGQSNTSVDVQLVVNPPTLESVSIVPAEITLIFDRAQVFSASAADSVGDPVPGLTFTWTVEGIPTANYTLNSTTGTSVNLTANITGTAWVNATATYNGVTKAGSALIPIILAPPTMTMSWANMPGAMGINWTCDEPSAPLTWDEVRMFLTDGTTTVNWTLTMGGLDGGAFNTTQFGPRTVGALAVFLNVTDVTGNGSVNATDYFTFTTSGGKFNPAKDYIVTLIFTPSLDQIAQYTFRG